MGLITAGVIAAAGALGSAAIGSHAAGKASQQEQDAGNKALGLQTQQWQAGQQALAPYQFGGPALSALNYGVTSRPQNGGVARPGAGMPPPPPGFASAARPTLGSVAGYGQPQAPQIQQGAGPAVGTSKTFPNGKTGVWDGQGWVAQ